MTEKEGEGKEGLSVWEECMGMWESKERSFLARVQSQVAQALMPPDFNEFVNNGRDQKREKTRPEL